MLRIFGFITLGAVLLLGLIPPSAAVAAEPVVVPEVLISEVSTRSLLSASEEFVELYNQEEAGVDLTGWSIEYKPATSSTWTAKATLAGQVAPGGFFVVATEGYLNEAKSGGMSSGLADSGGHVRLVRQTEEAIQTSDLLGWGTADSAEGGSPTIAPGGGESVQRCFEDGILLDTDNNFADFSIYEQITPGLGVDCVDEPIEETPTSNCDGVMISEVLPNPEGSDTGSEFIELYNPTADFVPLENCSLQTSANSTIYTFPYGNELAPAEYRALYDSQTGLTLVNSSGGTVYLLSANQTELHSTAYPADMDDNLSWAWFGSNSWQATYTPTPNAVNVLQATKPCPAGQERNPETNRCNNVVVTASTLTPCNADQERNPETNRCRKISTASSLAPCDAGQERNPETNRCRKISTASSLAPCDAGQERNPETNRCRKVAALTDVNDSGVQDVIAPEQSSLLSWWVAGAAFLGALGYGVFEWRQEIGSALGSIKHIFPTSLSK